jgi:hypothetical protein
MYHPGSAPYPLTQPPPPSGYSGSFDSSGSTAGGHPLHHHPRQSHVQHPIMPPAIPSMPPSRLQPPPNSNSHGFGPLHNGSYPPHSSFFPPSYWGPAHGGGMGFNNSAYPHPHHNGFQQPHHPHGLLLPPLMHPYSHPHLPVVEFITEIHPQDVLSGRGCVSCVCLPVSLLVILLALSGLLCQVY